MDVKIPVRNLRHKNSSTVSQVGQMFGQDPRLTAAYSYLWKLVYIKRPGWTILLETINIEDPVYFVHALNYRDFE